MLELSIHHLSTASSRAVSPCTSLMTSLYHVTGIFSRSAVCRMLQVSWKTSSLPEVLQSWKVQCNMINWYWHLVRRPVATGYWMHLHSLGTVTDITTVIEPCALRFQNSEFVTAYLSLRCLLSDTLSLSDTYWREVSCPYRGWNHDSSVIRSVV
jgi:hypothetical protein